MESIKVLQQCWVSSMTEDAACALTMLCAAFQSLQSRKATRQFLTGKFLN